MADSAVMYVTRITKRRRVYLDARDIELALRYAGYERAADIIQDFARD